MNRFAIFFWAAVAAISAAATPQETRQAIEAALHAGGTYTLPAGMVTVDQSPALTAGCTLAGDPKGTTLVNQGQGPALKAYATGLGYLEVGHISGALAPGDWVYRLLYDWQNTGTPRPLLCQITRVNADGTYTTNPPPDPRHNAILRFRRAYPCGSPKEGAASVTLSVPPTGLAVGTTVFVTDGPNYANAARGEWRKVVSVSGQVVVLDRPLRESYGPAVLAWVEPLENVTVKNITLQALPNGNSVTWGAAFKGCSNLRLENVKVNGALDIITCGFATLTGCSGPAIQLNTATECRLSDCRFGAFYAEEGTSDADAVDCEFGTGRDQAANCVAAFFHCARMRFIRCRIIGAGRAQWPPPSAFNVNGRDCSVVDCEVSGSQGGWSLFGGDGLLVRGFRTDGGFQFTGGRRAGLSQLRGPYFEMLGDDVTSGNRVVDAENVKASPGWQKVGTTDWVAPH